MTAKKSMADVAYDYIAAHKVAIPFKELWAEVSKESGKWRKKDLINNL